MADGRTSLLLDSMFRKGLINALGGGHEKYLATPVGRLLFPEGNGTPVSVGDSWLISEEEGSVVVTFTSQRLGELKGSEGPDLEAVARVRMTSTDLHNFVQYMQTVLLALRET